MTYFQIVLVTLVLIMGLGFSFYLSSSFYIFITTGVSSKASHVSDILQIMQRLNLSESDVFYDLGSGDGRVAIHAAVKTGCTAVGYEISPIKVVFAKVAARIFGVSDKVAFHWKRLEKADLTKADAIFCSLSPKLMKKLKVKFDREVKDGVPIVSESIQLPHTTAAEIFRSKRLKKTKFLVYEHKTNSF